MKLKVVKPKPKYYKISYAMLSYHLEKETPQEEEQDVAEKPVVKKATTQFATKYEKVVDMAITKGLVEEDERETKVLELQCLSEDDFDKYEKEVENAISMKVGSINDKEPEYDEDMTEAEKALAKIRATGSAPIMTDFSGASEDMLFDDEVSGSRKLKDIKEDRMMAQVMAQNMGQVVGQTASQTESNLFASSFENAMGDFANKLRNKKTASAKTPMAGLKGLTKPIVVPQKQSFGYNGNTWADKLADLNWSSGSR